tara:strand:- start:1717 stop:1917 length:201 start_codon:yes stop_codon:yes gene_type:complete
METKVLIIHSAHSPTFHTRLLKKQATTSLRAKSFPTNRLGHNPQFQLSITLNLPAMLGRNIYPERC